MPITAAQFLKVLQSVGAGGGMVASSSQLAAGANKAMNDAGLKTVAGRAAFLATMAQESAYFRTTTEYGTGQSYAPYIGRTFEQVTWSSNYAAFGSWAKSKGLVSDANVFVKNPSALSALTWAWYGGVWYWVTPRSWSGYKNLSDLADKTGSILMVSRAVNLGNPFSSSTPGGMSTRTALFNAFKALGSSLLSSTTTTTPPSTTPAWSIPGSGTQVVNAAIAVWNSPTMGKNRYYGTNWPGLREIGRPPEYWCADFVAYAVKKGTGWFVRDKLTVNFPSTTHWLRACLASSRYREVAYKDARAGDWIFFHKTASLKRSRTCYHMGLVEKGPTSAGHDLATIEGNTSTPGISVSMSNGGTLARKTRSDLDTAYYHMTVIRPPYYVPPAPTKPPTEPTPPPPTEPEEPVEEPVDERPIVDAIAALEIEALRLDPIDGLNPSAYFLAAGRESHSVHSRVSAWYDGQPVSGAEDLPLVASESEIEVSDDSPVRRVGNLVLQPGSSVEARSLYDFLANTPGIQLRVETGYSMGGPVEMVPVHTGLCDKPVIDWPSHRIKISSPDVMALIAMDSFGSPVNTPGDMTYPQLIQFLACESVNGSYLVDLTGAEDACPPLILDSGPQSRINFLTECAQAIGAELFASPVPGALVLRPYAQLTDPPRWEVAGGRDLISVSRTTDWSGVANNWVVRSERADSTPVTGQFQIFEGPLAWGGPHGRRTRFFTTSLLQTREQCETAAAALCARLVGARVDVEWEMLRNPLMDAGHRVSVKADESTYDLILSSFTIPLGSQSVTAAKARSLQTEGLS